MIDASTAPYAALLLRIGLGLLFLAHGNLQMRVYGLPAEAKYFRSIGLPGHLVYLTAAMQVVGGIALVAGIYTRFAALLLLPIIVGTIVTVHAKKGWLLQTRTGVGSTRRSGLSRCWCSFSWAMGCGHCCHRPASTRLEFGERLMLHGSARQ